MTGFSHLSNEDKQLLARLEDLVRIAGAGNRRFSAFLNESQCILAEEFIRRGKHSGCMLCGGYPEALRRVFGVFPDYEEPQATGFPTIPVVVSLPKAAEISHRDVLGSLMGLQIKRESVGDILISGRQCHLFLLEPVVPLVLEELCKIGRYGVRCEIAHDVDFCREEHFEDGRGTVSSLRLDCLVSLLTGLAREKSARLIRSELVQKNHRVEVNVSGVFGREDVITIRGYGKYKVENIGGPTRKGRLPVEYKKYQ